MRFRIALFTALCVAAALARGVEPVSVRAVVERYCVSCHDTDGAKGDLNLAAVAAVAAEGAARHPEVWEKVVRRLAGRQMPPAGKARPGDGEEAAGACFLTDAFQVRQRHPVVCRDLLD